MPAFHHAAIGPTHDGALPPANAALTSAALALLQRCGKRPSLHRIHVLESLLALDAEKGGTTVDQLYLHLQARHAHVSLPGIYKVLAELTAVQALDRCSVEHGPTMLVLRRHAWRTHLVCSGCQTVLSTDVADLRTQLLANAQAQGFEVDDVSFTLRGRCSACARQAVPARPRAASRFLPGPFHKAPPG